MNAEELTKQKDLERKGKAASDKAFWACVAVIESNPSSEDEAFKRCHRAGLALRRATKALSEGPAMQEALETMARNRPTEESK